MDSIETLNALHSHNNTQGHRGGTSILVIFFMVSVRGSGSVRKLGSIQLNTDDTVG